MNASKDLAYRREVTQILMNDEIETNKTCYNPVTKEFVHQNDKDSELHPNLYFIEAFRIALAKIHCTEKYRKEARIIINRLES